jgi:anti-sigma B factor antagonist
MPPPGSFRYEFEIMDDSREVPDSGGKITTVRCHGHLVSETRSQLERMFRETPFRGRIVIDLGDVNYVDSAGLGALIRLKLSAAKDDDVSLRFVNVAPGLMTLLRISNLEDWFIA